MVSERIAEEVFGYDVNYRVMGYYFFLILHNRGCKIGVWAED